MPEATTPVGALAFVGMTPCRVVDTRTGTGTFAGPPLSANVARNFPLAIQSGNPCPIPANALAYSLNVTAVPPGPLGFLTIWPQGLTQPTVSTLNDLLGTIVANAAIVPAGNPNGGISVFASNDTNLVIDINGYFTTQTGITLAAGSQSAPSLSFAGDSGTGIFSGGSGNIGIASGGAVDLTIANGGNVGIGVTNPTPKLQVIGNPDAIRANFQSITYPSNPMTGAAFVSGGGTSDYRLEIQNGNGRVNYYWNAFNNATNPGGPAPPQAYIVSGEPALRKFEGTNGTTGAIFAFYSAAAGTAGAPITWTQIAELNGASDVWFSPSGNNSDFFINSGGSTGIGTTGPRDKLEVAGELRVMDCVKNSGGTQIAGTCPSDARLKTNIEPFSPVLDRLTALQPVHFDWKSAEYPDYHFGDQRSYGLIAQEVERQFPELVSEDKQGFKAVNYSELPLLLLQGIRDLNAENHSLREENQKMEARMAALESLLAGRAGASAQAQ
jgi:hypothetical protein